MAILPALGKTPAGQRLAKIQKSPHYKDGNFQNPIPTEMLRKGASMPLMLWEFINKPKDTAPPAILPSVRTDLRNLPGDGAVVVWFGHSSYLIKTGALTILVDPVFCGYASPFPFSTKAFPGADIYGVDDLPEIDMVVITHDHYDHLDYHTMRKLASKAGHFYTSLGVGAHLEYWGIDAKKITELDWGVSTSVGEGSTLTAMPARHFSGRTFRRGQTLWSSFAMKAGEYSFFLGGDSGYGPHFKTIGDQFGPFDLAILECGQYGKDWPSIHMLPEETVAAAEDLRAAVLLPVHWGKFSLSLHPWDEPVRRVLAAARTKGQVITTPLIGEPLVLGGRLPEATWWEMPGSPQ